jgi:hypothetical protein
MSTVIARRVASSPTRTATQTWDKIVELVAPDAGSEARRELAKAAGVACAAISSEATKDAAIVVWGAGPRVRIYCVFDEDAILGEGVNEDALAKSPTAGDWRMSLPCEPGDVTWSKNKLAAVSKRISARSLEEDVDGEEGGQSGAGSSTRSMTVDIEEFMKS